MKKLLSILMIVGLNSWALHANAIADTDARGEIGRDHGGGRGDRGGRGDHGDRGGRGRDDDFGRGGRGDHGRDDDFGRGGRGGRGDHGRDDDFGRGGRGGRGDHGRDDDFGRGRYCQVIFDKCDFVIGGFCARWNNRAENVYGRDARWACEDVYRRYGAVRNCQVRCR